MKLLLNLGTGIKPLSPTSMMGGSWVVVNHDRTRHARYIDVAWDLNRLPWPWNKETITKIHAYSVLEHLRLTLVESFNECWRILRPGGQLAVKLPLWDVDISHDDPTHFWTVGRGLLERFDPEKANLWRQYGGIYGMRPWRLILQEEGGSSLYGVLEKREG